MSLLLFAEKKIKKFVFLSYIVYTNASVNFSAVQFDIYLAMFETYNCINISK